MIIFFFNYMSYFLVSFLCITIPWKKLIKFCKLRKVLGRISNRKIEAICGDDHNLMIQELLSKSFNVNLIIVNVTKSEVDKVCHTNPNFS